MARYTWAEASPALPTAVRCRARPNCIVRVECEPCGSPLPQSRYDSRASAAGNYAAVSVQQKFTDIADVPWAKNALEALAVRGIVDAAENGSERQLHPKQEMTRGHYVQWLITALGLNGASAIPFSDVLTLRTTKLLMPLVRLALLAAREMGNLSPKPPSPVRK